MLRKIFWFFFLLMVAVVVLPAGAQAPVEKVIYDFCTQTGCTDGEVPSASLIQAADGNFYGTTISGSKAGSIFRLSPQGELFTLYRFTGGTDGGTPFSPVTQGGDGNFYGATAEGGNLTACEAFGCGTIFKITPAGDFTTIYVFCSVQDPAGDCLDGAIPEASLVWGSDGNLYGTTNDSGNVNNCINTGVPFGCGTVFRITPSGILTTLFTFSNATDGAIPYGLIQGSDGDLYGVAAAGGSGDNGTVFRISPSGNFTLVYTFPANGLNGSGPIAPLTEGPNGNFYGSAYAGGNDTNCTTAESGAAGCGTGFMVSPSGAFSLLYTFAGTSDGAFAYGGLTLASDGNFYGTTERAGDPTACASVTPAGCGTVFQVSAAGNFGLLYGFQGPPDGYEPATALVQGSDGGLYGTTLYGGTGPSPGGTVFRVSLTPSLSAPVQLSLSDSSIVIGEQVALNWSVSNGFSTTMQQCYAFVQNSTAGAGTWTGRQTGALSGGSFAGSANLTPTAVGIYTYALTCGGVESGFATLVVNPIPALSITTSNLPDGTVGTAYSATLGATGGLQPYTWSVASGSLPSGLSLDESSGVISGAPTQSGTARFDAEVQDSENPAMSSTANLSITIVPGVPTLTVAPTTVTVSAPGGNASATLTVSGFSSDSLMFSCSGLPSGAACIFGSIQGSGASGTATLQITTTAPSSSGLTPSKMSRPPALLALALPGLVGMFGFINSKRRRPRLAKLYGAVLVAFVAYTISACGDSGLSNPGTPAGTTNVVVTATSRSQTANTNLTLVVQ